MCFKDAQGFRVPATSKPAQPDVAVGSQTAQAETPHYRGHRDRLRERFLEGGADALPDYEMLELMLFRAIPRQDTKPIAKALLARFGTFGDVLAAAPERLKEVKGVGDKVVFELKLINAAAVRLSRKSVLDRPALTSWQALIDYCTAAKAYDDREQFRVLFLDRKNVLIAD
jgi:DNA repair protein RadC